MNASAMETEAANLATTLAREWERNREYNLVALKKFPAAQAILHSDPALQIAVAKHIIETVCQFAGKGRKDNWFTAKGFPWGNVYFASSLLKLRLPFTEDDLTWMFERLISIGYISACQFEFIGSLTGALEKYARAHSLSYRLRKAAEQLRDIQLQKDSPSQHTDAADRKVGQRIDFVLATN